jgi:DNA modification methylase
MEITLWKTDDVRPYDRNPRLNDEAVDAVAASIREFGFRQPIVVDAEGVIVVGHTRWRAAKKLGLAQVPVHVATDLTSEQLKAYRIADNKTNELAEWNYELLPLELADLQAANYDLGLLAFSADELAELLGTDERDGLCDPDEVPAPPEEPITQPGDLWLLGDHRLLCGDSTQADQIERLLDRQKAQMLFTDPPWNVGIGRDSNPRHRQRPGLRNDSLPASQFQAFLDGFIGNARSAVLGDVYCVLGASEWPRLDASLRAAGFHWSATIIWVKDTFVLGRSKYHRRYEPIWYGWHADQRSSFTSRRDLDDVWEIARPKRSEEHPTMKPVELASRAIRYSSRAGQNVLDLFGGSGSTLIAAEQTGRKAFLMELDPRYADVIVERYQKFSGKKAERIAAQEASA